MRIDERIKFDEMYVSEEHKTTTYYYLAEKSLLEELFSDRYREADAMEISVEFPSRHPDAYRASVMVSPMKDGKSYDWVDIDIAYEEIEDLIRMAENNKNKTMSFPDKVMNESLKGSKDSIIETIKTAHENPMADSFIQLQVVAPLRDNFGLVVREGKNKAEKEGFFLLLYQDFAEQNIAMEREALLCGFVPFDGSYEKLTDALDNMLAFLERGLKGLGYIACEINPFEVYAKERMQPLCEALNAGDFSLAQSLTPPNCILCGYQEFKQDYLYEQYAYGWAGQFEKTLIPKGRYPVFAKTYAFSERDDMYMNTLKDFLGLSVFLRGSCIADSVNRGESEYPFENTVFESPYAHAVAHEILEGKSSIHLLPPFRAEPVHFMYDGESHITYQIVDMSLPPYLKQNPMELKNISRNIAKTIGLSADAKKLYSKFLREYSYCDGIQGRMLSLDELSKEKVYSKNALIELLVNDKIKMNDDKEIVLELSAKERLDLFHSGQMRYMNKESMKLRQEYEHCKQEYHENPTLDEQIQFVGKMLSQKSAIWGGERSKNSIKDKSNPEK